MSEFQIPDRHARLPAYAQSLTPPAGWKIEISGDEIITMAGPSVIHQRDLLLVRKHRLRRGRPRARAGRRSTSPW
ncbi:hypothetical protein [Kitasatospora sp. NPDC005856]|uniref:hypothetical protein n=1 Tax=Kitasatospora sp. NPDC005856 TaxID=3154566 RepID=UPI0033D654EC